MTAAKDWPATLYPLSVMFDPDVPSSSGGQSMSGIEQVVASSAGRWRARFMFPVRPRFRQVRKKDQILAARAMRAFLKGRTNTVYIGPYDCANTPSSLVGGAPRRYLTTHSDGSHFSDGSSYSTRSSPAVLTINADAGDLSMTVTMQGNSQAAEAGQYFGFGKNELYLIDTSIDEGGGIFLLTFWPPLRSDRLAGDDVNFSDPTCEMRLASDQSGELDFPHLFDTSQTLEFVEAL